MLDILYASAFTAVVLSLILLFQFQKNHLINAISRYTFITATLVYMLVFCLFFAPFAEKFNILVRDITILSSCLFLFRISRNYKLLFPFLFSGLLLLINFSGYNFIKNSFNATHQLSDNHINQASMSQQLIKNNFLQTSVNPNEEKINTD